MKYIFLLLSVFFTVPAFSQDKAKSNIRRIVLFEGTRYDANYTAYGGALGIKGKKLGVLFSYRTFKDDIAGSKFHFNRIGLNLMRPIGKYFAPYAGVGYVKSTVSSSGFIEGSSAGSWGGEVGLLGTFGIAALKGGIEINNGSSSWTLGIGVTF